MSKQNKKFYYIPVHRKNEKKFYTGITSGSREIDEEFLIEFL